MLFSDFLASPLLYLVQPEKRLFFAYLLTSLTMAFLILWAAGHSPQTVFGKIFAKKVWWHPSAQVDYQLFLFNLSIRFLLAAVTTLSSVGVALWVNRSLHSLYEFDGLGWSYSATLLLFTGVSFIGLDFSRFLQHYLMHKIPWLWHFHKVHHSAEVLTPMTLYRTHPVESLLAAVRRILTMGVIAGTFVYLNKSIIGGYEIIGVNIFDFAFSILGSNLRHSHIWLSFGPLNHLLISPAQHQIHHSRSEQHFDKNFGIALSIWDKMFGSFYNVSKRPFLVFGIRGENHRSLRQALLAPFQIK